LEDYSEIMARKWAIKMYDTLQDFNPDTDFFFGMNIYGNKMGVDVNLQYPLQPFMWSPILFQQHVHESADPKRHSGSIPSLDDDADINDDNSVSGNRPTSNSSQDKMQLYHNLLVVLLQELKDLSVNKPVLQVNLSGIWQQRKPHIHVCSVMGDQKSQDYLCGRKSMNNGNAGCVHRGCMALALGASDATGGSGCKPVD
jgi:hypothetical protein